MSTHRGGMRGVGCHRQPGTGFLPRDGQHRGGCRPGTGVALHTVDAADTTHASPGCRVRKHAPRPSVTTPCWAGSVQGEGSMASSRKLLLRLRAWTLRAARASPPWKPHSARPLGPTAGDPASVTEPGCKQLSPSLLRHRDRGQNAGVGHLPRAHRPRESGGGGGSQPGSP